MMIVLDPAQTATALPWEPLIDAVSEIFANPCVMPMRHHHEMEVPGAEPATLLLMPAWLPGLYSGVKLVSVFPSNGAKGLPAVQGSYLLSSGETGELLAVIDGGELTARRTAAASALAARHLARPDASVMLMVGTGRLALNLMQAHATVRPLQRFLVWGRSRDKAEDTVTQARALGFQASVALDLEAAVRVADITSCATLSTIPLVHGAWLKPGSHLDLVGAFKPSMRESDDDAMRLGHVYVDTFEGACAEAGDIVQTIESGALIREEIRGELAGLVTGSCAGRTDDAAVTVFKSVGAACEDLAGAVLAYETARAER